MKKNRIEVFKLTLTIIFGMMNHPKMKDQEIIKGEIKEANTREWDKIQGMNHRI